MGRCCGGTPASCCCWRSPAWRCSTGLVYLGLRSTTTVNAVLLNSSLPLFIAAVLLDDRARARHRAAGRRHAGFARRHPGDRVARRARRPARLQLHAGDAWILLAMPIWGVYSVLLKRRPAELGGQAFLFVISAAGVATLLPIAAHGVSSPPRCRGRQRRRRALRLAGGLGACVHRLEPRRGDRGREYGRLHAAPIAGLRHGARDSVPCGRRPSPAIAPARAAPATTLAGAWCSRHVSDSAEDGPAPAHACEALELLCDEPGAAPADSAPATCSRPRRRASCPCSCRREDVVASTPQTVAATPARDLHIYRNLARRPR